MQIIKIFLAFSNELKSERDKFQKEVNWKNTILKEKGFELQLTIWEDLSAQLSATGSQSDYNKYVKGAHIFVLLAYSKVGMYTEEEFEQAIGQFITTKTPFIFTYFKNPAPENAEESLENFKKKLSALKHFYASFTDPNDLWNQFNKELDRLEIDGFAVNYRPENILTRKLILMLKDKEQPNKFLRELRPAPKDLENWEVDLKIADFARAQNILVDYCFISIVGSQLRRLFAIGSDRKEALQTKINDYIRLCCKTYRLSSQLTNFLLLSRLWDEKIRNPDLVTNHEVINLFFNTETPLELAELRGLFQCLLKIFNSNGLELPIDKTELGDLEAFLDPASEFNQACASLEKLIEMDNNSRYDTAHYKTAVVSLTTILSAFPYFSNYEMISLKKVEYQGGRNSAGSYLKDYNYLEKKEAEILTRYLTIEEKPYQPYSIIFNKGDRNINLFPLLLDYNAVTGGRTVIIADTGFDIPYQKVDSITFFPDIDTTKGWTEDVFVTGYRVFHFNQNGDMVPLVKGVSLSMSQIGISPNGKMIAINDNQKVKIINTQNKVQFKITKTAGKPVSLGFSPDSKILVVRQNLFLSLYDLTGHPEREDVEISREQPLRKTGFSLQSHTFSANGDLLLLSFTNLATQVSQLYKKRSNSFWFDLFAEFKCPGSRHTTAYFSENEKEVLTSSDKVRSWNIPLIPTQSQQLYPPKGMNTDTAEVISSVEYDPSTDLINAYTLAENKLKFDGSGNLMKRGYADSTYKPNSLFRERLIAFLPNDKVAIVSEEGKLLLFNKREEMEDFLQTFKFEPFTEAQKRKYGIK